MHPTVTNIHNRYLRAVWRITRRALVGLLAFALVFPPLYALAVDEVRDAHVSLPAVQTGEYRVLVADWGYHTAILVEQPQGWHLGPPGNERAAFLEYAWGDQRFYMESDFRPHALFATLVLPTATVMYL